MTDESRLLKEFELFRGNGAGIERWISEDTPKLIFERLATIDSEPIAHAQLNQLLDSVRLAQKMRGTRVCSSDAPSYR
jgi:hypothetical protein